MHLLLLGSTAHLHRDPPGLRAVHPEDKHRLHISHGNRDQMRPRHSVFRLLHVASRCVHARPRPAAHPARRQPSHHIRQRRLPHRRICTPPLILQPRILSHFLQVTPVDSNSASSPPLSPRSSSSQAAAEFSLEGARLGVCSAVFGGTVTYLQVFTKAASAASK